MGCLAHSGCEKTKTIRKPVPKIGLVFKNLNNRRVVSKVSTEVSKTSGQGAIPCSPAKYSTIAQLVERCTENAKGSSSNLDEDTIKQDGEVVISLAS